MTINLSDNNPRANYTATSGQTAFTIPFDYFDDGDISVYQNGTLKTITTHYTISGSTVTLVTGATAGDKIAITRDVPLERTTDLTSTYNAASINNQLDTIVAQIADLDDRVSRSISLNDYEVGVSLDLPATADRLGKTIQFNSSTGALEVGPSGDELTSIASIASEITALDGISSNITSVAGYLTEINNVGDNIASVTSVSGSISSVGTVSTNIADVNLVAGSITDLNDVADSLDQVELVATSISNVDIVGPAIANVNTVASNITNINTVSGISSNITTVAGITGAISTVNSNAADITSVSNNIDDVNDVANVITKVTTVADNIANVNTVAPSVTYVSTLANNISNINILAPISADITAAAAVASDIGDAATNAAAAISAKTAAESARDATLAAFDSFDDRYLGAKAADPSVDNDGNALVGGALYYNTTDEVMKVYTGSAWVAAYASLSGALLVANNLSDLANAASARTNLGLGTAATTDSTDYVAVTGDSMTGDLLFGDNDKAIFGAGSDLQIYHDGSHSYIQDAGTGNLKLKGQQVSVESPSGNLNLYCAANGATTLYNNNSAKLATTSTGIDVTGTVTADGLTVDGEYSTSNGIMSSSGSFAMRLDSDNNQTGRNFSVQNYNGSASYLRVEETGDISFYEDTGTTPKMVWSASAESLGIGGASPAGTAFAVTNAGAEGLEIRPTGGLSGGTSITAYNRSGSAYIPQTYNASEHIFVNSGSSNEKMRIDSSGNVGIGTSSPIANYKMDVKGRVQVGNDDDVSMDSSGNGHLKFDGNGYAGAITLDATGMHIYHNASNRSLVFGTNDTERMRIDSSGDLLLGKTTAASTTAGMHLDANGKITTTRSSGPAAAFVRLTSDGSIVSFQKDGTTVGSIGTDTGDLHIYSTASGHAGLRFGNTRLQPTDNTGTVADNAIDIGVSTSRFKDLYLSGGVLDGTTTGYSFISGGSATNNGSNIFLYGGSHASTANTTIFRNGSSETMRIDSSGNLLVGTTDASPWDNNTNTSADNGLALRSSGRIFAATSSNSVAILNRTTSDGDIVQFRKSGSTVGSIGSATGNIIIGNGDTGVMYWGGDAILPWNISTNAERDGAISLGRSSGRFKDLYLSGGVYLGGTGAANKLDDYEEGTWTPAFYGQGSSPSLTFTTRHAYYTKIGRLVHASAVLSWTGKTGGSGQLSLEGLPFTGLTNTRAVGSISYNDNGLVGSNGNIIIHGNIASSNRIYFMYPDSTGQATSYLTADSAGLASGTGHFQITVSYVTT